MVYENSPTNWEKKRDEKDTIVRAKWVVVRTRQAKIEVEGNGLRIQLLVKDKQESKLEEQEYRNKMGDIEALEAKMSELKGELNASCSERQSCEEDDTKTWQQDDAWSTSDNEIDDLDGKIEKLESEIDLLKGVAERAKTFPLIWKRKLKALRLKLVDSACCTKKRNHEIEDYHVEFRDLLERPGEVLNLGMDPILYFPNYLKEKLFSCRYFRSSQATTTKVTTGTPERTI